ncbi:hypothetical protein CGLO_08733 [Colletotrichum gloeosporioides Cg-14]|uniref:Uncharacterized protein n=1 Tax=Colletotrichum gloeosporioides (strain Cg-14) TaxID=1237896 RepID=T0KHQ4_COLGC|nr:hypothetical protein CGLO_08733 [Colletotrichum gloeosporioides Cg-14]
MPADSTCQGEGLSDPIPNAQQHEMRTAIATKAPAPPISSTSVHRLIEIAREGPGGAKDPTVVAILEAEMTRIWAKLSKEPDTYVLSHDEFAVFNFFQFRSAVSGICRGARKRYWKQQALEHGDVKPSQDASQLPKDEAEDGSDEWTFIRREISRKRFAEPGPFAQFFDHELMKSVIDPIQVSILYSDQLPDGAFYTPSSSTYGYEISQPHSHFEQEGRSFTVEDAARQQHKRWKEIYLILFPEVDECSIPGPYFEAFEISDSISNIFDPREYEGFLKQQLPARLLTNLNCEFQLFSELAKLKLAEILKEESLAILKAYVLQKGGHSVQISENPAQSSGTEEFNTKVLDSGIFDSIGTFGDEGQGEFDLSILDVYYHQSEKGQGSEKADLGHDASVI